MDYVICCVLISTGMFVGMGIGAWLRALDIKKEKYKIKGDKKWKL